MDGWPTADIVLKVHTLFFLFFFFFFVYYVVLLLTVYWKADLALFRRPDLEKDKNKEQIWPGAVRLKIIIVRAIIQSWNFADFDLHISAGMGFRQWTIIMPLIPISCSSVSCCRRCLRCAKRCSFGVWHLQTADCRLSLSLPSSPSSLPFVFCFFLNFSPALYYLNTVWTPGTGYYARNHVFVTSFGSHSGPSDVIA